MLTHLSIRHLAVVERLELSFEAGMTVFTGETGAGKSILIDALGLTLGERAESSLVRAGHSTAEISALYDIHHLPLLMAWLVEHGLEPQDNNNATHECIIRRTITSEGRSRAYINGRIVPIQQLKELGEFLVNIHGQHQHQALLKADNQRLLLDEYGQHTELCATVRMAYQTLQKLNQDHKELQLLQTHTDKLALLEYQIQELEELNYQPNECIDLEAEYRKLTHAKEWLLIADNALTILEDESIGNSTLQTLHQAVAHVLSLKKETNTIDSCYELLTQAVIHIEEAVSELTSFRESITLNPERLIWLDERLSQIHALVRKHRITPELILEHHTQLKEEAQKLSQIQVGLSEILDKIKQAEDQYQTVALQLRKARQNTSIQLAKLVMDKIQNLEMINGRFEVQLTPKPETSFSSHGIDDIEFLLSTNPGLPLQPLRKIASGGELSRLSLAIQVITSQKMTTPSLIFDEVDVGISGKTAEIVGELLRQLGNEAQVLCVTHLPQVAAKGHQHFKVEKQQDTQNSSTTTSIRNLSNPEKIQEIARLLGGIKITKNTLAHAEEMLCSENF
jgi:DNA repair protein RecN (Recombination protein N)